LESRSHKILLERSERNRRPGLAREYFSDLASATLDNLRSLQEQASSFGRRSFSPSRECLCSRIHGNARICPRTGRDAGKQLSAKWFVNVKRSPARGRKSLSPNVIFVGSNFIHV
jgi:hypothetical protein